MYLRNGRPRRIPINGSDYPDVEPQQLGGNFPGGKPWLLRFFDQIRFYPVSARELEEIRNDFPSGKYSLQIEESNFDLKEYDQFLLDNQEDISRFKSAQRAAFEEERLRWKDDGDENLDPRPRTDIQESQAIPNGMQGLESQVTGSLWKWMVKPGDAVECGQKLGIIESMKMEIPLESQITGTIHSLLRAEGELVKNGEFLLLIEKD